MLEQFEREQLQTFAIRDRLRPFLIGMDEGRRGTDRLTVHTVYPCSLLESRRVGMALREAGVTAPVKVRHHSQKSLSKARSLEALLKPFRHGGIVADPTGAMGRAHCLVDFATALRSSAGDKLLGLFWDAERKLVVAVLDHRKYFVDEKVQVKALAEIEDMAHATLTSALGDQAERYVGGIKLGFEVPDIALVAIDETSYRENRALLRKLRTKAFVAALGTMIGLGALTGAVTAEEVNRAAKGDPAVSATNFDLGVLGGVRDGKELVVGEGSVTMPLGHMFGVRLDATGGVSSGDFAGGAAGHLFWRDPSIGLIGIQGGYFSVEPKGTNKDEDFGRVGGFAELYLQDFTILANAGGQFGGRNFKDGFYGSVGIEWFATDNLMFHVQGEYDKERDGLARFGVEYLPGLEALPGLSFYAEAAVGAHKYERVLAGFRIHFGQHGARTLKERYRYDTFRNTLLPTSNLDTPDGDDAVVPSYTPPVT